MSKQMDPTAMSRTATALRHFRADTDGASTAWSIFWTIAFLTAGGFVIDTSNAYRFKTALQATADASAMAAIDAYYDPFQYAAVTGDTTTTDPRRRAGEAAAFLSRRNMDMERNGSVVTTSDVTVGYWDGNTFSTSGYVEPNAVKVTARRTEATGNALDTLLLGAFGGFRKWDVGATAIARAELPRCDGGGFFSAQQATSQSTNTYTDRFCLHGELGVDIQQDNWFEEGTTISMADLSDFSDGGQNTIPEGTLKQASELPLTLAENVDEIVAEMQAVTLGDPASHPGYLPFKVTNVVDTSNDWVGCPAAGTVYIVRNSKKFELSEFCDANDFAVVAYEVIVKKNSPVTDALIASPFLVKVESDAVLGSTSYCAEGRYSVSVFSIGDIFVGSYATIHGLLMGAQGNIYTGSDNVVNEGIYAEALGNIEVQSSNTFGGCPSGIGTPFDSVAGSTSRRSMPVALVQ